MLKYRYGIIVIGYKNAEGIKRLLNALNNAEYKEEVLLIVSVDYSNDKSVLELANLFRWEHGAKIVRSFTERLGLRKHVLTCGDYLNTYDLDAIIVFEDDMMPTKDFFLFSKKATEKYISNQSIAGISLYTHCTNFQSGEKFVPMVCEGDNYFFQCAQSRGQVWFKNQWNDFRKWYENNKDCEKWKGDIPQKVLAWPETSWLKYHIKYCIDNGKYFVYPYISYSTCFGEVGQHVKIESNRLQVPLSSKMSENYNFIDFSDDALKYDAFFENEGIFKTLHFKSDELMVDLYGQHENISKRYLLTKKRLAYKVIKSWGNKLIPHELNIIYNIPGESFFLYDLQSNICSDLEQSKSWGSKLGKKLILYGSGVEGKKWLQKIGKKMVYGFANTDDSVAGTVIEEKRIFSLTELEMMRDDIKIFISTNYENRQTIYQNLKRIGMGDLVVSYPYIDKEISVDFTAKVDAETELEGKNYIYGGTEIKKSIIGYASYVKENIKLENVFVGKYSCIESNVEIIAGRHLMMPTVAVSPLFYSAMNQVAGKAYVKEEMLKEERFTKKEYIVEIGNDVWIGSGVGLMEGVTIADGTIIMPGSRVIRNTEPYSVVGGNPAQIIKYRFDKEEIEFLLELEWWNKSEEWIKRNAGYFGNIKELRSKIEKGLL